MDKRSKAAIRALIPAWDKHCEELIGDDRIEDMDPDELAEEGRKFCITMDPTLELVLDNYEDEQTMLGILFSDPPREKDS